MATELKEPPVGRPKASDKPEPKRYGTLIRVSDRFADAIREASSFEKLSVAEFADTALLPITEKRFKEAVTKAAKRLEGKA